MTPEERVEYQTVVLGALLYDVWRYLQASELEPTTMSESPQCGWNFVAAWRDKFARCTNADLLEVLVQRRHETHHPNTLFKMDATTDPHHRALVRLVCQAHRLASGQPEGHYDEAKGFHLPALIPIFSRIRYLVMNTNQVGLCGLLDCVD